LANFFLESRGHSVFRNFGNPTDSGGMISQKCLA